MNAQFSLSLSRPWVSQQIKSPSQKKSDNIGFFFSRFSLGWCETAKDAVEAGAYFEAATRCPSHLPVRAATSLVARRKGWVEIPEKEARLR